MLGALWVVGIPTIWPDEPIVPVLVSGVGILAILLFAPGGFAGLLRTLEDLAARRRCGREVVPSLHRPIPASSGDVRPHA